MFIIVFPLFFHNLGTINTRFRQPYTSPKNGVVDSASFCLSVSSIVSCVCLLMWRRCSAFPPSGFGMR